MFLHSLCLLHNLSQLLKGKKGTIEHDFWGEINEYVKNTLMDDIRNVLTNGQVEILMI